MTAAPLLTADDTEHDGVVNAVDDATMQSSSRRNFIIMDRCFQHERRLGEGVCERRRTFAVLSKV